MREKLKYDGSVQCHGPGVDVDTMALELLDAGIELFCSQQGHDGLSRPAVCGEETGNINIYTINTVSLPAAEVAGFQSVDILLAYQDEPCH